MTCAFPGRARLVTATRAVVLIALITSGAAVAAQAQELSPNGLTGHLVASVNGGVPEEGYTYGVSFYNSVFPLNPSKSAGTQLGWGMWLTPNNQTFNQPLCPEDSHAGRNWPEQTPFRHLFQTIEGGIGLWVGSKFPSSAPKFRVNAVPDCYDTQIGSPGWAFHADNRLTPDKLGLAQLSNRLLLPPDGMSFTRVTQGSVMGYGWLALPLISPHTSVLGAPTGGQNWTLFFNTANFKGPVAFFVPDIWSALSAGYPTAIGKGHDARPGLVGGVAMEIGQTPVFTASDQHGARYRRVPKLTFDADETGTAVLQQDLKFYSKAAIWDRVGEWIDNGTPASEFDPSGIFTPPISGSYAPMTLGGDPLAFEGFYAGAVKTSSGADAFGMKWSGPLEPGVFPEYFKEINGAWTPISADQVPAETRLTRQKFPLAKGGPIEPLDVSTGSAWDMANWSAGPFTAKLSDSLVEYVWYRFVDQPAIAQLGLDASQREYLQRFVESLHEQAGVNGLTIPPPSSGTLARIDAGLIVKPPPGLTTGYVPIVIRQYRVTRAEIAALEALYHSTNGPGWTNSTNWLSGPVYSWHGVTVGNGVTGLDLFNNNLTGTIPDELGSLTALESLELSYNQLSGPIPDRIGRLRSLRFFSAYNNDLTGSLPPGISKLGQLYLFQVGANRISGPIPASWGNLSSLQYLFLGDNELTGPIPAKFGQLTGLRFLELHDNALSGPLPASLTNLTMLDTLRFNGTGLCVPSNGSLDNWLTQIATVVGSGLTC
jgi:hypothetical protein